MLNKNKQQIKADTEKEEREILEKLRQIQEKKADNDIERFIIEAFEQNYELLSLESGSRLTPDGQESALKQVLMYWRKMKHVAKTITSTEVKLSLPNQRTSRDTVFTIEGVVDIIRDNDKTIMYDIKTHEADLVLKTKELYQKQINVYAHIWQSLRNQDLDQTCIIATAFPQSLKEALAHGNEAKINTEVERWNPEIEIEFSQQRVHETIAEFTQVVEKIEDGLFAPPSLQTLQEPLPGTNTMFVTRVCRNCDARFSCDAYRTYAQASRHARNEVLAFYADYGSELDQAEFLNDNLSSERPPDNVDDLI